MIVQIAGRRWMPVFMVRSWLPWIVALDRGRNSACYRRRHRILWQRMSKVNVEDELQLFNRSCEEQRVPKKVRLDIELSSSRR